jgi:hypothetical protein
MSFIADELRGRLTQLEQVVRNHGNEIAEWEATRQAIREHLKIADALNDESRTWVAVRGQDVERINAELQSHLGSHKMRWDTQQQASTAVTTARITFKQVVIGTLITAGLASLTAIAVALINALAK